MSGRPKRKAVSNTETKAKRARGETDLKWDLRWHCVGKPVSDIQPLLVLDSETLEPASKAVGFDIDFTLINTLSGRKFATGSNDWQWWDESVPEKLRSLHEEGYRILLFTNQAGIEKGKVNPETIKVKVEAIIAELDIPVLAYVSTATSNYRKPSTEMWEYFVKKSNKDAKIDLKECVFVGDAAGRAKNWAPNKPKDFSCSDRMFAANIGIDFFTPEEYFLGEKAVPFEWKSVNPKQFLDDNPEGTHEKEYHSDSQELVLMVGCPASGKSTFSRRYLVPHGYVHVNRDTLHTPAKCLKATEEGLKAGSSVVVDNTNPAAYTRADYIKIAKKYKVPCRCFVLETARDMANHLNFYRMNQTNGSVRRVPDVAYAVFNKNFETPATTEGFTEIQTIPFIPQFDHKKDKDLFTQWT